jgi:hypothetical protein
MGGEAVSFTEKELLEAAEGNAEGIMLATLSYLHQKNLSVEDWAKFVGKVFAPGWDEVKGQGVDEVARVIAINVATTGGRLLSVTGDEDQAEVVAIWPAEETWLSEAHVQRKDIQPVLEIFGPIADRLGIKFEGHMEDEGRTTIKLSR